MIPISEVEFGPADADTFDRSFLKKYVEELNFKKLIDNKYSIITGEKGSGKSALIKGLRLKHGKEFTHISNFKFDNLSFSNTIKNLQQICSTVDLDILIQLISYWEYSLIVEAMTNIIKNKKTHILPIESDIYNYLTREGHLEEELFTRLLSVTTKIWQLIDKSTSPPSKAGESLPGGLTPELIQQIQQFPLGDSSFKSLLKRFSEYLKEKELKILITLDELDKLTPKKKEDLEQIAFIFEGLVAATYNISTSEEFSENILIKTLVPYDVYISINPRDLDKYEEKYSKIRWDYSSLQEFLRKRIIYSITPERTPVFDSAWEEIMPKTIYNDHIGIKENSYEYILRHTLYRPRQFQIHLKMLSEEYEGQIINQKMVKEVIQESTKKLVIYWLIEHKMTCPRLDEFIMCFRKKPNIMSYNYFRNLVSGIMERMGTNFEQTLEDKIDSLYKIGFIGLKREVSNTNQKTGVLKKYKPPVKKEIMPYICDFYFVERKPKFTHGLDDDDTIVIHSMFYDYCDLNGDKEYIVG